MVHQDNMTVCPGGSNRAPGGKTSQSAVPGVMSTIRDLYRRKFNIADYMVEAAMRASSAGGSSIWQILWWKRQ